MDLDQLEVDIRHIEEDISSIGLEVHELESEHKRLLKQVQLLERDLPSIDVQETIHDSNIPAIIKHNHFDNSIREFFSPEPISKKRDFESIEVDIVDLKENILYENIFRIGGVTAFPLNRYLFDDDDHVLGLRFDIFSSNEGKFLTPHYVILRQVKIESKDQETRLVWSVYRHTLPVYVPLDQYAPELQHNDQEAGLRKFAHNIRLFITRTQYKRDKFDLLKMLKPILNIEQDLQCQRIRISIGNHILELECTIREIIDAKLTSTIKSDDILQCENLLKNTTFNDLTKNFKRLLEIIELTSTSV